MAYLSDFSCFYFPGSHGSGDDHEIQTPYVIWGAGVRQVKGSYLDLSTLNMSLEHRRDIHQADLTPLMSTVLSIPVPVNSIVSKGNCNNFNRVTIIQIAE